MSQKRKVLAIGLDAAEPMLLHQWMKEGKLKNLKTLEDKGFFSPLENLEYPSAELPWTTFLTGCTPEKTRFWQYYKLKEKSYETHSIGAYDFKEYPPFYALGENYKVAVFDVPQTRFSDQVNGLDIQAWGSHAPMHPSASQPENLYQELVEKYGPHPLLHDDYLQALRSTDELDTFRDLLKVGIDRRVNIIKDLLSRDSWDLFLTVFSETHSAGHGFWHFNHPSHPLYKALRGKVEGDPMLEVFEKVDQAIGEILALIPEDTDVVVFAAHGMGDNSMDLPSILFLPELLHRFSFDGQAALAEGVPHKPISSIRSKSKDWELDVWRLIKDPNPVRRFLRRKCPYRLIKHIDRWLGVPVEPNLISPQKLKVLDDTGVVDTVPYQPAAWYMDLWPKMKAFALPSFSEGYIRINLEGREPEGLVKASNYDMICDELSELLYQLKDSRTGKSMVKEVIRTRQDPFSKDTTIPDPDLIIIWQKEYASDSVDSPTYGRIGPVPHYRGGSHRPEGFILAAGPNVSKIEANTNTQPHVLDLAPTILDLMDAPIPDYLEGTSLVKSQVACV